jgi:hypothetical protein
VLFTSLLLQSITKQAEFQIVVAPAMNESNLALDHRVIPCISGHKSLVPQEKVIVREKRNAKLPSYFL